MRTRAAEKSWRDGRVFADDRETKRCYPQTAQAVGGQQVVGGRGGIRTHVRIAPKPDFESGAFNHSATLPLRRRRLNQKFARGKSYSSGCLRNWYLTIYRRFINVASRKTNN